MGKPHRIAPDAKEQILKRIKDDGIPVAQAAKDHGIRETAIYGRLSSGVSAIPALREPRTPKKENPCSKSSSARSP